MTRLVVVAVVVVVVMMVIVVIVVIVVVESSRVELIEKKTNFSRGHTCEIWRFQRRQVWPRSRASKHTRPACSPCSSLLPCSS